MKFRLSRSILMIIMPTLVFAEGTIPHVLAQSTIQEKQVELKSPFRFEPNKDTIESAVLLSRAQSKKPEIKFDLLMNSVGTNSGGGGDSVIDPRTGKKSLLDLAEMDEWPKKKFIPVSKEYLKKYSEDLYNDLNGGSYFLSLDYYWTDKVLLPQIQIFAGIAGAGLMATLSNQHLLEYQEFKRRILSIKYSDLQKTLDQRIEKDGRVMRWLFVDFPLEEIDDEGVIRFIDASTKKQLAVQKNGIVAIQKQEFDQLDSESQAALFLHEAFLFSALNINPGVIQVEGTSNLRLFVKRFFDYEKLFISFYNDRNSVDEATLIYSHLAIEDAYKKLMKINTKE